MLSLWTIYDHPRDYPRDYVAREFLVEVEAVATANVLVSKDIDAIRDELYRRGFVRMERLAGDDPCIVETWI